MKNNFICKIKLSIDENLHLGMEMCRSKLFLASDIKYFGSAVEAYFKILVIKFYVARCWGHRMEESALTLDGECEECWGHWMRESALTLDDEREYGHGYGRG